MTEEGDCRKSRSDGSEEVNALGFATRQVHAGEFLDSDFHARVTPVYQSAAYVFDDFDDGARKFGRQDPRPLYSRIVNPTNGVAEARLASLEGAAECRLAASGQAAVTSALLSLAGSGDTIVTTDSLYSGTVEIFADVLERAGVRVRYLSAAETDEAWSSALADPSVRGVFTESIPNPNNDVVDVDRLAALSHSAGVPLVVDNTVATPYLFRPFEHGADVVVHSTSKWLAGHGELIGGAVLTPSRTRWADDASRYPHLHRPSFALGGGSYAERYGDSAFFAYVSDYLNNAGGGFPAISAALLLLGMDTLSLRMERQVANAQRIAEWLAARPEVAEVRYAGLSSSPAHAIVERDYPLGAGSIVTIDLVGGLPAARAFYDALHLISRMTHIGDVRTLAIHCASTLHAHLSSEQRAEIGITDGLIRLSIGIEDVDDLLTDLDRGLRASTSA